MQGDFGFQVAALPVAPTVSLSQSGWTIGVGGEYAVIKDVAKTIDPMATKNGNRLVIDCPASLGTIHADQTRFRQSLLNLASNANKFTEKGTITIVAHQGQENGRDWIALAVTDTGIGMTPEQLGKLFQEFLPGITYPAAPLYENLLWHRLFLDSCRNWCSYVLNTIVAYTARKNVYQRTILPNLSQKNLESNNFP